MEALSGGWTGKSSLWGGLTTGSLSLPSATLDQVKAGLCASFSAPLHEQREKKKKKVGGVYGSHGSSLRIILHISSPRKKGGMVDGIEMLWNIGEYVSYILYSSWS